MRYCFVVQSKVDIFSVVIVWLLVCVESSTWSKPVTSGSGPSSRDKLASAVIGQNIYYFGGFGPKTSPAVRNNAIDFLAFFNYV